MHKGNLVLHCGANAVHREELAKVVTPDKTDDWCPVPHETLVTAVQNTLVQSGASIVTEAHGLTRGGLRYFGLLQVHRPDDSDDFGLVIGVRNSHDKSFGASLALGANVFVCDNLSFRGEVKLSRKHTKNIERDLPALVLKAIGLLDGLRTTQEQRFVRYKLTEMADKDAHDLMIRALDNHILPCKRMPELIQEWRHPRHPEFTERTAWRLMNAFTETLKGNLTELPKRTIALQGMLDLACGFNLQDAAQAAVQEVSQDAAVELAQGA